MVKRLRYLSLAGCLATGTAIAAVAPIVIAQQNAQGNFPDTQNYWAKPFIAALAQRDVLNGYPDGTYRPNAPVQREEFAAIIREAFEQGRERQIPSGSAFRDVPNGYWAAPAIEEAHEMGFMAGYPDNTFRPGQPVTRAEALTSLARNLELSKRVPSTAQNAAAPAQQTQAAAQSTPRQQRRPIVLPLAALSLMQPLMNVPAARAATQPTPQAATPQKSASASVPANTTLESYYDDAGQIPQYARDAIASVTRAGVVVNHPNQRQLRPNQPATRGEMAAFIHQALVNKGQLPALTDNVAASRYIVGRDAERSNNSRQ